MTGYHNKLNYLKQTNTCQDFSHDPFKLICISKTCLNGEVKK